MISEFWEFWVLSYIYIYNRILLIYSLQYVWRPYIRPIEFYSSCFYFSFRNHWQLSEWFAARADSSWNERARSWRVPSGFESKWWWMIPVRERINTPYLLFAWLHFSARWNRQTSVLYKSSTSHIRTILDIHIITSKRNVSVGFDYIYLRINI